MKWLLYLFSLYVLVLSGIPCSADDDCCMEEMGVHAASGKAPVSAGHKPCAPCSPFFACGACHGVTIPDNTVSWLTVPVAFAVEQRSCYIAPALADFSPAIWQPPKAA
ncbi:hypothetical protein [Deminuibacter soli]|nr:hypothetical protein [Deminuibacter soli]